MKKTLALFALFVCALAGQASPGILFTPLGWPLCENPVLASLFPCPVGQYAAGSEPDLLQVAATSADVIAFRYVITGVGATGEVKSFSGIFARNDDSQGYSSTVVYAGNLSGVSIHITELIEAPRRR